MTTKTNISMAPIMVDLDDAAKITGLAKSTIQSLIRDNDFPKPRQASKKRAGWLVREIIEWAESRPPANFLPPPNTAVGGKNRHKYHNDSK